jgi:hypothetical protein
MKKNAKRYIPAFIIFLMLCTVSCSLLVPKKLILPRIPFPQAEYAKLPTSGTGIVSGRAFLKRGGDILTAAGERVILNPVTSYSNQWYTLSYIGLNQLEPPDPRINKYLRAVTADAQGKFIFRNVPPGDYYIITVISWQVPAADQEAPASQGARLCKKITVQNGEETRVMLNQ